MYYKGLINQLFIIHMKYIKYICADIPHTKIQHINIPLNGRNLIITGQNGAGKTSLLKALSIYFNNIIEDKKIENVSIEIESSYNKNHLIDCIFKNLAIIRSFNAQRLSYISEADETYNFEVDNKVSVIDKDSSSSAIDYLEYHLLNLKINSAFFKGDENPKSLIKHKSIELWFNQFDDSLKLLFDE